MELSGEQPPEQPTSPQPGEDSRGLYAIASGHARVTQAGRDVHIHYKDGIDSTRRVEASTPANTCPYPGLASFGREQARWFFGRDQLISELINRLDARLSAGGVQAVIAASGAGKSSLLHAGLLFQLGQNALDGSSRWPTIVFTPTANPVVALATHIAPLIKADPKTLAEALSVGSPSVEAVVTQVLLKCIGAKDP